MTPVVDIIIPTFGRPDRLQRVVDDAHAGMGSTGHVVTLVVEADDEESVAVAGKTDARVVVNERAHNYAGAVNMALEDSPAQYWFGGADDLHFHPGWFDAAYRCLDEQFLVIGTNDLLNAFVLNGLHATHYLVDREYTDRWGGTLDQGPGVALFEGYFHQWTDTEFVGVAKARVRFRPCLDAVVEHLHFTAGKSAKDATYERAYAELDQDRVTYQERKRSWDSLVA